MFFATIRCFQIVAEEEKVAFHLFFTCLYCSAMASRPVKEKSLFPQKVAWDAKFLRFFLSVQAALKATLIISTSRFESI
jgi:hypothetical protein